MDSSLPPRLRDAQHNAIYDAIGQGIHYWSDQQPDGMASLFAELVENYRTETVLCDIERAVFESTLLPVERVVLAMRYARRFAAALLETPTPAETAEVTSILADMLIRATVTDETRRACIRIMAGQCALLAPVLSLN